MKTTIQIFYDEGLIDKYAIADEKLKEYLLIEVNDTRRPEFGEVNDVINDFIHKYGLKNKQINIKYKN